MHQLKTHARLESGTAAYLEQEVIPESNRQVVAVGPFPLGTRCGCLELSQERRSEDIQNGQTRFTWAIPLCEDPPQTAWSLIARPEQSTSIL